MAGFHTLRRANPIIAFIGCLIGFTLAGVCFLFAAVGLGDVEYPLIGVVALVLGMGVFIPSFKGAWHLAGGNVPSVFSCTVDEISWGKVGREKRIPMKEIFEIEWTDDGDSNVRLHLTRVDGKIVTVPYFDRLVQPKQQRNFATFLKDELAHKRTILPYQFR